MRIGIFGGSFDPIHSEHVEYVEVARIALALDRVVVMPSYIAPHKRGGASADEKSRFEMCKIAFAGHDLVEVSDYEITCEDTSYTYRTCRHFKERYPDDELFFLIGADMLEGFETWREPDDILQNVTLAACGREEALPPALHTRFMERFGKDFVEIPFTGDAVSSTEIRVALAFRDKTEVQALEHLDSEVLGYIIRRGLYRYPSQERALELETPARRAHSYRVARMAVKRARSLAVSEEKALLAAMLHDCAKYVPLDSPMIAQFDVPRGVPEPVVHQHVGAYLAEHKFGITDQEILDAIRYHASGREDMTLLGKLIYLADLLEEDRNFPHVEELRNLYWKDIDACLLAALEHQIAYLRSSGGEIYSLTERAYEWAKVHLNGKN